MSSTETVLLSLPVLYLLPAMIASIRHHVSAQAILAMNLVLGWTIIGWIVALIWSLAISDRPPPWRGPNSFGW
jgi:hypothetical protein